MEEVVFFPWRRHVLLITSQQLRGPAPTARTTPGCFIYDVIPASSLLSSPSFYYLFGQNMMWAKRVGILEATSCTCAGASPGWGSYSYFKAWLATIIKLKAPIVQKKPPKLNNSNEVCSPKVRLRAAGLISRCIYLLWPSPHVTAPSLWPCVGRSDGQSTSIVLHLGGWGGGNYGNTAGPAEYHSLGNVFIIMAIICPCNGFHTTLSRLSRKERTAVHAASLGGTPPSENPVWRKR